MHRGICPRPVDQLQLTLKAFGLVTAWSVQSGGLHRIFCYRTRPSFLAINLRDLSAQYPRSGGERGDHGELAQQFSGFTHVSELAE